METILDSQEIQENQKQYAGFWIRVGASFIDGIILGVLGVLINLIFSGGWNPVPFTSGYYISVFLRFGIGLVYMVGMESSAKQATLGKMAVGIKVGNLNGERLSVMNALGRYLAKMISALTIFIGFMMVGWDPKKQGLHDKMANTIVFYQN